MQVQHTPLSPFKTPLGVWVVGIKYAPYAVFYSYYLLFYGLLALGSEMDTARGEAE